MIQTKVVNLRKDRYDVYSRDCYKEKCDELADSLKKAEKGKDG